MSEVAPHTCPQCGCKAYVGFCVPPRCTNGSCMHFDMELYDERVAELGLNLVVEREYEGDWVDDADTDPMLELASLDWFDKRK